MKARTVCSPGAIHAGLAPEPAISGDRGRDGLMGNG